MPTEVSSLPSPAPTDPVAVFDSGVGGLTVLHELMVHLPSENFLYYGDTANFPYGDKSPQQLVTYAVRITKFLLEQRVKLLVIACNSATATSLSAVQEAVEQLAPEVKVIGVITPEATQAARLTAVKRVGLLATEATVKSGAYTEVFRSLDPEIELVSVACPLLAPTIQNGFPFQSVEALDLVRSYVRPLAQAEVDTVVLGCTHYPLVQPMIRRLLGGGVEVVSAGAAMVDQVRSALALKGLTNSSAREGDYRFLCSGEPESFTQQGSRFLQMPIVTIEQVKL